MKIVRSGNSAFYSAIVCIFLLSVIGCKSTKLIEYSSVADIEQKASGVRTEMFIIKADDQKIRRNYFVVSAIDYSPDGKKNYYLIIVPSESYNPEPKIDDLLLQYDYPFIIQGLNLGDFASSLEKCIAEWDGNDPKFSGSVYNYYISSPQSPRMFVNGSRIFETIPYIRLNYSKTENGAMAKLALGSRTEEIIISVVDGKTVKNRLFVKEEEKFWIFDSSDKMRDFQTLIAKGLLDLRGKGMEGSSKKTEIKAEKIQDAKSAEAKKRKIQKTRKK